MLCTTVSAWSQTTYSTQTITLRYEDCDESYKTTDSGTGIYVSATKANDVDGCWKVEKLSPLQMEVPDGYIITGVKINYLNKDYLEAQGITGSSIDICDKLVLNGETWEQKDGAFSRITMIRFRTATGTAYVRTVTITYHKHLFTHNSAVAATCVAPGNKESWTCSDCGHTYYDEKGAKEVAKAEDLILPIDPTNHPDALEEHARTEATCIKDGNVQYWHCSHCNKNFGNENGTSDEIIDVIIPKEQGSHNHLSFVAQKDATCTESGVAMNHYHCSDCGKNYEEEACTTLITASVTIPAINHTNKTFTEAVAPTAEKEGNVAYWYCPDCEKHFGNEDCTKELTEWTLEKLVNMMHLDFTGPSAPIEKEHYLNTTKFNFTDEGDVILTVNGEEVIYDKGMIEKVHFYNGTPTVQLHTNEDPDELGNFYTTFYSGLEAYTIPEGVKAYTATIEGEYDDQVVMLTRIEGDILPQGAAVLLHSTTTSDMQMTVSSEEGNRPAENLFIGVNVDTDQGYSTNYMLSYGQNGLGFYKMGDGMMLSANKAFIPQSFTGSAKAFRMAFADEEDGIGNVNLDENSAIYNLQGVRLNKLQKGINIVGGKKIIVK